MGVVNEPSMSMKAVQFENGEGAQAMTTSRTASPEQSRGRAQGGGNRTSSQTPIDTRGGDRQRSRSSGPSAQESGDRQSDWQPTEQGRDTSRPRYNNNQEFFGGRQYGQERQGRDSYDGQPRTYNRGGSPRRGIQPSFFRGGRRLLGVEIGLVGKHQIRGKTRGKTRGKYGAN